MIRPFLRASAVVIALLLAAAPARAQDLSSEIAAKVGQTIDLRTNHEIREKLVAHGIITPTTFSLHVTPEVVNQVFGVERFYNHVFVTRYHVGDRILVKDDGSGGDISPRAEIEAVNPDGTYKVKIWDKPESLNQPSPRGHVPVFGGEAPSGTSKTKIKVHEADGSTKTVETASPWLVRDKEREETLTHDQIEELNGVVKPKPGYSVNGWTIDPDNDPVLAERLQKARAAVDEILPASALELPEDPKARAAKLDEIAKLQEKLLNRIFADNFIEHPGNNPQANDRMNDVLKAHPELSGKIGAVLESQSGVCTDQAAAMVAILNEIGPRAGLGALAIGGQTIAEDAGHGFVSIHFANGQLGMYDVTWHFEGDDHAVDNLDFATFDARRNSNRRIHWTSEETTDKTPFVDPASPSGVAAERGYDQASGEALLAGLARERATKNGEPIEIAAERVLEENKGLAGNASAHDIATKAGSIDSGPRTGATSVLDALVKDRLAEHDKDVRDR